MNPIRKRLPTILRGCALVFFAASMVSMVVFFPAGFLLLLAGLVMVDLSWHV
jgi:hypothetical protein